MNVVFLGPPGAGKGTQAETLSKQRGMEHISTGEMLRGAVDAGTPVGLQARKYMEKGALVPDEVVVDIVAERIGKNGCRKNFLLDGFPRNLNQAEALDKTLSGLKDRLDVVFYFAISEETVVSRLTGRWMCSGCGSHYHQHYMPPKKPGVCDKCGKALQQRPDDKVETVKERLKVYRKQTADLIDYYEKQGLLIKINADRDVKEVYEELTKALDSLNRER
ncbi:MAG TPA: adenylate kinase [Candidatus Brocadiales bacterium]|nr:adenylate kinase [Candidatus Brocadiales bacterium]